MSRVLACAIALLLPLPAALAQPEPKEEKKSKTAEAVQELRKEYQVAQKAILAIYQKAEDEKAKEAALKEYFALSGKYAGKFLKLAQDAPKDPAAEQALLFVCVAPGKGEAHDKAVGQALALLAENHLGGKAIATVVRGLERSANPAITESLRTVHAKAPDEKLRLAAGITLANNLRLRYEDSWREKKAAKPLFEEAEKVLTELSKADTANEQVENQLYELKNLSVGMKIPEIKGEDIDGKEMKLSDFRGRVVVVTFWGAWCPPCRAMIPHERGLVARLEGKPFTLLGVNSDKDRDKAKAFVEKEKVTWRSFWNEGSTRGPISTAFKVRFWPTIYVIDGEGVIRYRNVRGEEMDHAVDALLKEAEGKKGR